MKILISELPKVRDLIDELIRNRNLLAGIRLCGPEMFSIGAMDDVPLRVTKEEVTAIYQARVDATLRELKTKCFLNIATEEEAFETVLANVQPADAP